MYIQQKMYVLYFYRTSVLNLIRFDKYVESLARDSIVTRVLGFIWAEVPNIVVRFKRKLQNVEKIE